MCLNNLINHFSFLLFQISLDIENKNGWKECFTVPNVKLPVGYYFGVSAATGELAGMCNSRLISH